jgi:hypothetical protein
MLLYIGSMFRYSQGAVPSEARFTVCCCCSRFTVHILDMHHSSFEQEHDGMKVERSGDLGLSLGTRKRQQKERKLDVNCGAEADISL